MILQLLDVVIPVFLVIAAGYAAARSGFFKTEYVDGLMVFTQGIAIPVLLGRALYNLDLAQAFEPRLSAGLLYRLHRQLCLRHPRRALCLSPPAG